MTDSPLLYNSLFNEEEEEEEEEDDDKMTDDMTSYLNLHQNPIKHNLPLKYQENHQPSNSILQKLPPYIISNILEYVTQFDLVNLSLTCSKLYLLSVEKLYKRVTIIINAELPIKYKNNSRLYIEENGYRHMDTSLIFTFGNLINFINSLLSNYDLIQFLKFFIFDKCLYHDEKKIVELQNYFISFFSQHCLNLNFLHISFIDFNQGIRKLTHFLSNEKIRSKMFKLLITNLAELYTPYIPPNLTNLFLMIDDYELDQQEDLYLGDSKSPYNIFNSLFTLTCSTTKQLGLSILDKLILNSPRMKLRLKGLTIFHKHKIGSPNDFEDLILLENHIHGLGFETESQQESQNRSMKLDFQSIHSKIDINYLNHLYLKIDCNEHRDNLCRCYESFFSDFSEYSKANGGLPNLRNFEIESYPNLNWLRPHQQMENILIPLGGFIKTLGNLSSLTIDFSTPGFKMFDNNLGLSNYLLNKLNEHLMEAFFLSFFTNDKPPLLTNLKVLQLPDFFTSFIYYKPDFMESLLHTCKCWGCQIVLDKLEEEFHILNEEEEEDVDLQSTYYMLIGYILGKLQADREVCIPIKEKTFLYSSYPIYKGQAHTLHHAFHVEPSETICDCDLVGDPQGMAPMNIDNLVTIYIVHQTKPIIRFLTMMFLSLESLMIHGIYFERSLDNQFVPIYDPQEYPAEFLRHVQEKINNNVKPKGPFGNFRK